MQTALDLWLNFLSVFLLTTLDPMNGTKKYLAECIGTFILTFMGYGSAVFLGAASPGGYLAVALAFGLSIVAAAYVIGGTSGCHVNPAVSFAMLLDKRLSGKDFAGYVIGQVAGAIVTAAALKMLLSFGLTDMTGGLGTNSITNAGGAMDAFLVEVILTAIFVFTILGVTADASKSSVAGIVIGLTLTFVHIVGIPLTGTSVNPARSIGPALFAGSHAMADLWVFIAAPLVGAAVAVALYHLIKAE